MVTVDQVFGALKKVIDPELHKDVVSMGMIKDVIINNGMVAFTLELTTPACPFNSDIEQDVRNAVASLGIENLNLKVTARVMEGRAISIITWRQEYFSSSQWKGWSRKDNCSREFGSCIIEDRCKGRIIRC